MQATPILTETLNHLRIGTRRIIHQGGSYSGKTVNILGGLATLCAEEINGGVTTVTAQSFPHLKGGALRDFEDYVYPTFKSAIKQYHKTDHVFTFKSGSKLEFKVFESEMAARGQKRKRLFVNEANSFDKMVWFQLDSRSEQSIIDYNPSIRFWAHEDLIDFDGNVTLYSDHRHNPFLTPQKHQEIESFCTFAFDKNTGKLLRNEKGEPIIERGDYELWKVYARGITGNVMGVIFPNWQMIDDDAFPRDEDFIYSIDFGYTNDPTALMRQVLIGNTLYVDELAYETGLPVSRIYQILKENKFDFNESILYCEHDPDMIRQLRNAGIYNAQFARKGQGSVNAGIELLKQYNVKYTARSRNLHRERGMYIWETDKITGKLTNIPIDNHNHTFDAIRYGAYTRYLRNAA
jgi:phage terminase large subunit